MSANSLRLALFRAAAASLSLLAGPLLSADSQPAAQPKEINLFIWGDYIDPEALKAFEKETGVKVIESNFSSNEEMLAKVQSGAVPYDVATPSDYMVRVMGRLGLLRELDHARLPNLSGLAEEAKGLAFDPHNRFSAPYKWGVTGIGYLKSKVKPAPESWDDLLNPEKLARYRGRVSMLDDLREVIGSALALKGFSNNTVNPDELAQARAILLAQKPFLAKYDSSSYYESLAAGELVMAMGYSQEIALAQQSNPEIEFALPKEGCTFYMDNLVVPKTARRPEAAHAFINFLLRPDISARVSNFTRGPSPVAAAKENIDPELREGIAYRLPPPEKRLLIDDVGEAEELYSRLWTELKAE